MNILMLMSKEWPENRATRNARTLQEAGHRVTILARDRKGERSDEDDGGIRVRRQKAFQWAGRKVAHLASLPSTWNPLWQRELVRMLDSENFDVVHVHDLPLMPLALEIAAPRGCRIVFDLHENFPAMMEQRRGLYWNVANRLGWLRRMEMRCAHRADALVVVCDEQKERLIRIGIDAQRIHVVGNTTTPEALDRSLCASRQMAPLEFPSRPDGSVVYSGILGPDRGLEWLVRGFGVATRRGADAQLVLIGDGTMRRQVERLVREEGIAQRVTFTGWVDYGRAFAATADASLTVIPHQRNEHIDHTYPNKLFEYMGLSRPVIVSDAPPLKRIVEDSGAGFALTWGDDEALGDALVTLLSDPERREAMGRKGREAIEGVYNHERDQARLRAVYTGFADADELLDIKAEFLEPVF